MIGRTLSHFRILSKLGEGGMGVVYLAEDERLKRKVALKVLPPALVADEERRLRFLREARVAASVSHPNIAAIYEIDEAEGVVFIAMELVEGRTLREEIGSGTPGAGGRPLPLKEALRVANEIAEGLAHAHQAHVVHRDLKPDNVILRPDGHAKILDFGLAKLLEDSAATRPGDDLSRLETISAELMTREGRVFGTAPYMSPEQARGVPVDARSDIFSFGSVLYEMVTGRAPFQGKTATDVLTSVLRDEPAPPSTLNPQVPPRLEEIIGKCLEKDPAERYQRADELVVDLRRVARGRDSTGQRVVAGPAAAEARPTPDRRPRLNPHRRTAWIVGGATLTALAVVALLAMFGVGDARRWLGGATPAGVIDSLAVLPLDNLSGDPQQDYFADGMTDALITNLAQIRALRVISRTSVMRYKEASKPTPEIARELGVDAVVQGSVFRAGDQVRITAQLVEGRSDRHLWARSYERGLSDVMRLQAQLSQEIVREIQVALRPEEKSRLGSARTVAPDVYQLYLEGTHLRQRGGPEAIQKAMTKFDEALRKEPAYAPLYLGLGLCHENLGYWGFEGTPASRESIRTAKELILKALELDDELAEAHSALGLIRQIHDLDLAGAEKEHLRALELSPGSSRSHSGFAVLLVALGRTDEALEHAAMALKLDPLSEGTSFHYGWALAMLRKYPEAVAQLNRTLEMFPDSSGARYWLGSALARIGRPTEAIAHMEEAVRISGGEILYQTGLVYMYAVSGRRPEAEKMLETFKTLYSQGKHPPYSLAWGCMGLGRHDEAVDWLEKAYEERWGHVTFMKANRVFDPLSTNPRYRELLKKIGLEK